jgi:hypothetical protein
LKQILTFIEKILKHFFDYLGTTYTKESRGVMIKNKKEYIADMVKQYKKFKKGIAI